MEAIAGHANHDDVRAFSVQSISLSHSIGVILGHTAGNQDNDVSGVRPVTTGIRKHAVSDVLQCLVGLSWSVVVGDVIKGAKKLGFRRIVL